MAQSLESDDSSLRISGFRTLGVAHVQAPAGWGFLRSTDQPSSTRSTQVDLDSRLGVQLNYAASPQIELVGELLATRRASNAPVSDAIEWAFAAYRPTTDLTIRAWRLNVDQFVMSDYRNVGFAYLYARPPVEYYGSIPSNLDGADAARSWNLDGVLWRAKGFVGRSKSSMTEGAGRRTPIIALTANSLSGDRGRCLAAGMDDHVAKPFRRAQLRTAMARWVGMPGSEDVAPSAVPDPQCQGSIDRQALLLQFQIGGRSRPALVAKVIGLFLADTPPVLGALAQGLQRQDQRAVERAVHTLKSSAASVGALTLSELAATAEAHARNGALEAVQSHVDEIRRQFDLAVAQLQALRAELLQPQVRSLAAVSLSGAT